MEQFTHELRRSQRKFNTGTQQYDTVVKVLDLGSYMECFETLHYFAAKSNKTTGQMFRNDEWCIVDLAAEKEARKCKVGPELYSMLLAVTTVGPDEPMGTQLINEAKAILRKAEGVQQEWEPSNWLRTATLEQAHLQYVNDFISIDAWAEYHNISTYLVERLFKRFADSGPKAEQP